MKRILGLVMSGGGAALGLCALLGLLYVFLGGPAVVVVHNRTQAPIKNILVSNSKGLAKVEVLAPGGSARFSLKRHWWFDLYKVSHDSSDNSRISTAASASGRFLEFESFGDKGIQYISKPYAPVWR